MKYPSLHSSSPSAADSPRRVPPVVRVLPALGLAIALLAGLCLPLQAANNGDVSYTLNLVGMIDVTTVRAYPAGTQIIFKDDDIQKRDSAPGINRAIKAAQAADTALHFPSGTYYVSSQILGEENPNTTCGSHDGNNTIQMIGQTTGARPVIRLKDYSPLFKDAGDPLRAVVTIRNPKYGDNCAFRDAFRGIDIHLGNGNIKAVGIEFDAAQDSFFEDVTITAGTTAARAFAGFTGIPGRGMSAININVIGGQYGFYSHTLYTATLPLTENALNETQLAGNGSTSLGGSLVGVTFESQTKAAIHLAAYRGMSITGLKVVGQGPAIILKGGNYQDGHVSILDASIDITAPNVAAIENSDNRFVNLRNVYVRVKGAGVAIVDNGTGSDRGRAAGVGDTEWTRVVEYTYTPFTFFEATGGTETVGAFNLTVDSNGVQNMNRSGGSINPIGGSVLSGPPPEDIATRHHYPDTISFLTPDVSIAPLNANRFQIQTLLDASETAKVYLRAGEHLLDGPLVLGKHDTLMGVPGLRSVLKPTWTPSVRDWVIETANEKDATTLLQDIAIDIPSDGHLGGIRWQAGRNSVVRRVRSFLGSGHNETDKHNYEFVGNGGGRWYGLIDHAAIVKGDPLDDYDICPAESYRKVFINGTREPLTFYGFNVERGGSATGEAAEGRCPTQYPFVELNNAQNVRFLGTKSEARNVTVLIRGGSKNIFIPIWFANHGLVNNSMFEIEGRNDNLAFYGLSWGYNGTAGPAPLVASDYYTSNPTVTRAHFMGAYKIGSIDLTKWERVPITVEFESATIEEALAVVDTRANDVLLRSGNGDWITFSVPFVDGKYKVEVTLEKGPNRGQFQFESGATLTGTYAEHPSNVSYDTFDPNYTGGVVLNVATPIFLAGKRYFRFRMTGKNSASSGYFLALDKMTLTPQ